MFGQREVTEKLNAAVKD